jgi:hypothetical protein
VPARKVRKPAKSRKKPGKLGFRIMVNLPTTGVTRKADISILTVNDVVALTDRCDLGDSREKRGLRIRP